MLSSSPQLGEALATNFVRTRLPQPTLGNIGDIEKIIRVNSRLQGPKERVCEFIQSEVSAHVIFPLVFCVGLNVLSAPPQDYIKSLIDVLIQAEDLESLENLHALCSCMQTIRTSFNLWDGILSEFSAHDDRVL